jgi:hypothetical protein
MRHPGYSRISELPCAQESPCWNNGPPDTVAHGLPETLQRTAWKAGNGNVEAPASPEYTKTPDTVKLSE